MTADEERKAKQVLLMLLGWVALALLALLFGCDQAPGSKAAAPRPEVDIEEATIHYDGDRGELRLTMQDVPPLALVRVDHPLCGRMIMRAVARPGASRVDTTWTTISTCPPPPAGREEFQAVLWLRSDSVLATDTYVQYQRYGGSGTP